MKTRYALFLWICFTWAPALLHGEDAKTSPVASTITTVTVYEDRALVTRRTELKIEPGEKVVAFAGLPAGLMESSLRATGKGTAKVTILGLETEPQYLKEAKDERVKALEDEIDKLEEKSLAEEDRGKTVDLQIKFIDSIKSSVSDKISREMLLRELDPAEWGKVVEFLGKESNALNPALRETQKNMRDVKKEIDAAKKKLNQIVSALPREQKNVKVTLAAANGGDFTLDLSYMINGASWEPVHDIRADRQGGSVDLTYCGEVRQTTGEDWTDVELELSTARPSVGGKPPELAPWYIAFQERHPIYERAMRKAAAPMAATMMQEEAAEAIGGAGEEQAETAQAEVMKRGEAVTFKVKKKETVPSDNNPHKTTISSFQMKAAYEYFAVPKLMEQAYLTAKVKNEADYPLLAGAANVFLGPEYVGTSRIQTVAPGEDFDLYLGIDEGIRVKRKLLIAEAERSSVKRRTGWKNYRYRIDLENHKERAETITVLDQLPVSREPDIKVTLVAATPEQVKIAEQEKPGALSWKIALAPGEKKVIEFEFSVSYPKDKDLSGIE
ncbi:MAG: mucoidy inhibitor MuiA family protein [Candidatus Aureabacteria bacterium]|nr:mucoidy inhibitor MuiA family protein [Candidatus Auribacterota bacterium]